MAEEPNAAGAPPAGAPPAAAAAAAEPPKQTVLTGGAAAGAAGDPPTAGGAAEPSWREDWREALAGEDGAFLKQLERHTDPNSFARSYRELEKRRGAAPATLPENATPEEVSAYRKAAGVPDSPDGYGFAFPETLGATEADAAVLSEFKTALLENHVSPSDRGAKAAFDFFVRRMETGRAAQAEAVEEATLEQSRELRGQWKGREYTRNVTIAQEYLTEEFKNNPEALDSILNATLPNGVKLGNFAPFIRKWAEWGSQRDDQAIVAGDAAAGGPNAQEEYKALVKESVSKPKDFAPGSDKQRRLEELAGAMARRSERQRTA